MLGFRSGAVGLKSPSDKECNIPKELILYNKQLNAEYYAFGWLL
jgi:hypothetical protein